MRHPKRTLAAAAAASIVTATCAALAQTADLSAALRATVTVAVTPGVPLHEQTLAILRASDAVLPPVLDIHPVTAVYNREAVIPPQCYTRTDARFNPCYTCHQNAIAGRENTMNDADLQLTYSFSDVGMTNHWRNLFEDRTDRVAAISDHAILEWIGTDNYSELAPRLLAAGFRGYVPDLANLEDGAAAFDELGFAKDGSGWVAFKYKPLPSTFWPTNGSTDDVMIRLPDVYRTTADGAPSRDVYAANLAILEATIKGLDSITTPPLDERAVGEDLDGDGTLGTATRIARVQHFVGAARQHLRYTYLYPLGTEFLHSVRYVGVDDAGNVGPSRRMKELRYMRKIYLAPKHQLAELYLEEGYQKDAGYLPAFVNRGDQGLDNEMGWTVQGFIEDRNGRLRASTYEENLFCMGCHSSIGSTIDKTFALPRKPDGAAGWGYLDLRGMPDAPSAGETRGEIVTYLERVGGGSEFRNNDEMLERWFTPDGRVDMGKVAGKDVYELITPSRERALALDKAYRTIVADQDFIYGRDAAVTPPANVYERVDNATAPTLPAEFFYPWDLKLDWSAVAR